MTTGRDLRTVVSGYDSRTLDLYKRNLATRLKTMSPQARDAVFSRIRDIPQLADLTRSPSIAELKQSNPQTRMIPKKPTRAEERDYQQELDPLHPFKLPKDAPLWSKALNVVGKPFEIVQDYVLDPLATGALQGEIRKELTPQEQALAKKQGLSAYFPGGYMHKAYEEWESPTLFQAGEFKVRPIKGALEMLPWLAVPPLGVAAKGTGIAGALARQGVKQGGKLGKALQIAGKAVEYSPQGTMEKIPGAVFSAVRGAPAAAATRVGRILEIPPAQDMQAAVAKGVFSQRLLGIPGVRKAVAVMKWAAQADDPIKAARVVEGQMMDMADAGVFGATAKARLLKVPIKVVNGEIDDTAIKQITDLPNGTKSKAIHDIVEYADRYDMPVKSREYINEIRDVSKEFSAYAQKENLPVRQLKGEPDFVYLHRVVKEVRSDSMNALADGLETQLRAAGSTLLRAQGEAADNYILRVLDDVANGRVTPTAEMDNLIQQIADTTNLKVTRQAVDKSRFYETVADGIKAGIKYADDPLYELQMQGKAIYRMVLQKRIGEILAPLGKTKEDYILKELGVSLPDLKLDRNAADSMVHAINQGLSGKSIAGATIDALDKRYPGAAHVVRGVIDKVRTGKAEIQYARTFLSAIKGAKQVGSIPYGMVRRIKNEFPQLGAEVERVMSIGMPEFEVAVKGISDDVWRSMKIDRQRFMNAINSVRATKTGMPIAGVTPQNITMTEITEALQNINAANWQQKAVLQKLYIGIEKEAKQLKLDEIKKLIPQAETVLNNAKDALEKTVNDMKVNILDVAKGEAGRLQVLSRKAEAIGQRLEEKAGLQYGKVVGVPGVTGRYIEPQIINGKLREGREIADEIRRYFAWQPQSLIEKTMKQVGTLGGIFRMGKLSLDMSAQFIQTLPILGLDAYNLITSPLYAAGIKQLPLFGFINKPTNYWAKGVKAGFQAFVNPAKAEAAYWARPENLYFLKEAARYGGLAEPSEIVEAYGAAMQWFATKGKVGQTLQKGISSTYGRAEAAFTATRNITANEYRKGMWEIASAAGRLDDMVKGSNLLTGVLSTRGMGQSALQRNFESGLMFMSPRMTRSNLAVLGDILWNPRSWTGREASKAITGLLVANAAVFSGASLALGQKPRLNPLPKSAGGDGGEWLTVKIGDKYFGLGGIMNDIRALSGIISEGASDPDSVLTFNQDNPILVRLRQKVAPPTAALFDYLKGRDYQGNPIRGESLMPTAETALYLGKWGLPVFAESMINEGANLQGVLGEFFGMRTFPESSWNLYKNAVAYYVKRPYTQISQYDRNQIEKAHPDVVELKDIATQEMERRGYDKVSAEYWQRRDDAMQERLDILSEVQKQYDAGNISGSQARGYIQDSGIKLGAAYKTLETDPKYAGVLGDMAERAKVKDAKALEKGWLIDYAYNRYWGIIFNPENMNTLGEPDYTKIDLQLSQLQAELGAGNWNILQDWVKENQQRYPFIVRQYYASQETLKPYWKVEEEVWGDVPDLRVIADRIKVMEQVDERKARDMLIQSGRAADILYRRKLVAVKRKRMRLTNPAVEAALKQFYS